MKNNPFTFLHQYSDKLVGSVDTVLEKHNREIDDKENCYAFFSFFLNHVLSDKSLEKPANIYKLLHVLRTKIIGNSSAIEKFVLHRINVYFFYAAQIRSHDLKKKGGDITAIERAVMQNAIVGNQIVTQMSMLPLNVLHRGFIDNYAKLISEFCTIVEIPVPKKKDLLIDFFAGQFSRSMFDPIHLIMDLGVEGEFKSIARATETNNTTTKVNIANWQFEDSLISRYGNCVIRKSAAVKYLWDRAANLDMTVIQSIAINTLLLSKISSHLNNAPVIFLGRICDLMSRGYPLASTCLGLNEQKSFAVSFSGTPDAINQRLTAKGNADEITKNYIGDEAYQGFMRYLDRLGLSELGNDKPILICDIICHTGYGLRRFIRLLGSYYENWLSRGASPDFIFVSPVLHAPEDGALYTYQPRDSDSKFFLNVEFNAKPEDGFPEQESIPRIDLKIPTLVVNLMDAVVFEERFSNNIYLPACRWKDAESICKSGGVYSKDDRYSNLVIKEMRNVMKDVCAGMPVEEAPKLPVTIVHKTTTTIHKDPTPATNTSAKFFYVAAALTALVAVLVAMNYQSKERSL